MLRVLFDVVDTWSNPLGAGISDSRPFAKNAKERDTHCVGNACKIKSPGHPALGPGEWPVSEDSPGIEASPKFRQGVL